MTTSVQTAPTSVTTVTSTYTSTTHASVPTGRNAYSLYAGCLALSDLVAGNTGIYQPANKPVPFTASTAVQECYYSLANAKSAYPDDTFTVCAINSAGWLALYGLDLSAAQAHIVSDDKCSTQCEGDSSEYCGGPGNYMSIYSLAALS